MLKKIKNICYFMHCMWKIEKWYILFRIPQIIINALSPFIMVIFPKLIIDRLTEQNYDGDTWSYIFTIILVMVLLNFIAKVGVTILNTCNTNAYNSFSMKYALKIGEKVMDLDYKNIENPEILNLFERTKGTGYCEKMYSALAEVISNGLTCVGLIFVLSQINILVVCVILVVVFINMFCNRKVQKYDYEWHIEAAPYNRITTYLVNLMHDFRYGKEVRLFREADYVSGKYNKVANKYLAKLRKITFKFLKLNLVTTVINILQQGGVYLYLAYEVYLRNITLGTYTMLLSSVEQLTNCLVNISYNFVNIGNSTHYIEEFIQIMSLENEENTENRELAEADEYVIEFQNVSFKYPRSSNFVLENINTKFSSKDRISIVGTNGSGKTTFIKLLLRLYYPTKGKILINGIDIKEFSYESYIKIFSAVFQDYKMLVYSMRENITLEEENNDPRVEEILKEMNFFEKAQSLDKGIDTMMSKEYDPQGVELSGGEQQKVVIARALYRKSSLLILDEPTSALDPLMEYDIYNTINTAVKDRGIIFISHRLSVTQFCDKVFVFDKGHIVQNGIHTQLMQEKDKLYFELYTKQAEFYKEKAVRDEE